ncbi:MAG: hypothetical protein AB1700_21020, partial [Bacillota bacterium]
PYHRLGGGADLAGLIVALTGEAGETGRERVFSALLHLLRLPYELTFSAFQLHGLPVSFVESETAAAKAAFGDTPVYTGIQTWSIPVAEIGPAAEAARRAGADGLFFYCYGWSSLEALDEIGQIVACAAP